MYRAGGMYCGGVNSLLANGRAAEPDSFVHYMRVLPPFAIFSVFRRKSGNGKQTYLFGLFLLLTLPKSHCVAFVFPETLCPYLALGSSFSIMSSLEIIDLTDLYTTCQVVRIGRLLFLKGNAHKSSTLKGKSLKRKY
ncbi:hypothetical protein NL676_023261 [Syzygium grande]|nr:hypothetical protein NL676_023261 [Syzygium grande]